MVSIAGVEGVHVTSHNNILVSKEIIEGSIDEETGDYIPGNSFGTFRTSGVFFTKPVVNGGDPYADQPEDEK